MKYQFRKSAAWLCLTALLIGSASPCSMASQDVEEPSGNELSMEEITLETMQIVAEAEENFVQEQDPADYSLPVQEENDEETETGRVVFYYEEEPDLIEDAAVGQAWEDTQDIADPAEDPADFAQDDFWDSEIPAEDLADGFFEEPESEDLLSLEEEADLETEEDLMSENDSDVLMEDAQEEAPAAMGDGDFKYVIKNGAAVITGYTGSGTMTPIPSSLGGYPVEEIGKGAFRETDNIDKVVIPKSVKVIGEDAFFACSSLKELTFESGSGVEIGEYAFCITGLTKVTFPADGNIVIGPFAFATSRHLDTIDLNGVVQIGPYAFEASTLKSVTTGSKLKTIAESAFRGCDFLTSVTLKSVTKIEYAAFSYCAKLETVSFPAKLDCIDLYAFLDTKWLNSKAFGPVYQSGALYLYKGAAGTSFQVQNGTRKISPFAFHSQAYLQKVTIPSTVDEIGQMAFFQCPALKEVLIPASVKKIGNYALGYKYVSKGEAEVAIHYHLKQPYYGKRMTDFIIYGEKGSAAQAYAKANGFEFRQSADYGKKPGVKLNVTGTLPLKVGQYCADVKATCTLLCDSVDYWESSAPSVVKVNKTTGKIYAFKTGTAKITVHTKLKAKASYKVKVMKKGKKPVIKTKKITVKNPKTIKRKQIKLLKPVRNPLTSEEKITFKSSNTKVLVVTKSGKIKGVRKGKAKVTIQSGSAKVTITIKVK